MEKLHRFLSAESEDLMCVGGGRCTCLWQEGHGCSRVVGSSPVLWLIVEA